jgi:hypothetical protein
MTISKSVSARERLVRLALTFAGAAVALAACGGGSSGAGAQAANSVPAQTSAPAASSAPATSPPATSAPPVSGGGSTSFCGYGQAQASQLAKEEKAYTSDTPAQLEQFEQQALNEAEKFAASAPSSIKPAMETALSGDQQFLNELKAVNYDFAKLSPSALSKINTPAYMHANQTLANYFRSKCGISTTASP